MTEKVRTPYPKAKQEAVETVVCFLMAEFGPDGHTDGSDVVAYGVLKALGYNPEYPDNHWHKKESVDAEVVLALSYHQGVPFDTTARKKE